MKKKAPKKDRIIDVQETGLALEGTGNRHVSFRETVTKYENGRVDVTYERVGGGDKAHAEVVAEINSDPTLARDIKRGRKFDPKQNPRPGDALSRLMERTFSALRNKSGENPTAPQVFAAIRNFDEERIIESIRIESIREDKTIDWAGGPTTYQKFKDRLTRIRKKLKN